MKIEWNKVTWYSKLLALVIFILLPCLAFWYGVQYGELLGVVKNATTTTGTVASSSNAENSYYKNTSEWQTYNDTQRGFAIAYPIDFPDDENYLPPTHMTNWSMIMDDDAPGIQDFKLTIPPAFEPQTNFEGATLTVSETNAEQLRGYELGCLGDHAMMGEPYDYPNVATSTLTINNANFTVLNSGNGGAGSFYETTSYRTLRNGECYAIEYTIHSSQIANYPASYNLQPFDKVMVTDVLDRIVGTFKFQ
jgi:hypothetical protein